MQKRRISRGQENSNIWDLDFIKIQNQRNGNADRIKVPWKNSRGH